MASSSSKMTPEKVAADLRKKWSPAEYKEKLQEQLSLAMAFEGPEQKGFTVVGEKSERLEQMRQLNLYKSHLKKEIDEEENEDGTPPGFAMPVRVEGGAATGSTEGGEEPGAGTGLTEGGDTPQEDAIPKRKRKKRKRHHTEAQNDAAEEGEVQVTAEGMAGDGEKKKKRKRRK